MFEFFNKFFKILQKVFDEYIFADCHFKPKFWQRHCSTGLEWNSCMKFCLLSPPAKTKSGAAPDSHSVITIFHDEDIDIFAFSSARQLHFTLYDSAYFVVFYILQHIKKSGSPEAKSWSRH